MPMVTAAVIFIVSGFAYASWGIYLALTQGPLIGFLPMAAVSAALCYQGYALLRRKKNARLWGIIAALPLAVGSAVLAVSLWNTSGRGLDAFTHGLTVGLIVIFAAFTTAVVALFVSADSRPNNRWRGP